MNAIVIQQEEGEAKLAFEVNRNAALNRIRLARAKLESQAAEEMSKLPVAVTFRFKSRPLTAPSSILRLEVAFRMSGDEEREQATKKAKEKPQNKESDPLILVECAYEIDYLLNEGFSFTPEHVKAFKDGNAIFNAWPYFREYLQNSLQRMGLPSLTAPFLRLQPKPSRRTKEKSEPEAEKSIPGKQ